MIRHALGPQLLSRFAEHKSGPIRECTMTLTTPVKWGHHGATHHPLRPLLFHPNVPPSPPSHLHTPTLTCLPRPLPPSHPPTCLPHLLTLTAHHLLSIY